MLIPFKQADMLYRDYHDTASEGDDAARVRRGAEAVLLNRRERYELLYFIQDLAEDWGWTGYPLARYQRLERIIRKEVTGNIRSRTGIQAWIEARYTFHVKGQTK